MNRIFSEELKMEYNPRLRRRMLAGKEVVVHCHHYNIRLQRTIELSRQIDGKSIIRDTAEAVFFEQINNVVNEITKTTDKFQICSDLYSQLGYGLLQFDRLEECIVVAPSSHFVEGWKNSLISREGNVCSLTEGYIQAVLYACTGKLADVREKHCMHSGKDVCEFEIDYSRTRDFNNIKRQNISLVDFNQKTDHKYWMPSHIQEQKIIDAVVGLPIVGNEFGLIPIFNVYLTSTPQEFYNMLRIRYIEEMKKVGCEEIAKEFLQEDAEYCALHTFSGIMNSEEWDSLVSPMIHKSSDNLFALIAFANALGWGKLKVLDLKDGRELILESNDYYEALGFLEFCGKSKENECLMLTGLSIGLLELIYSDGELIDRVGNFSAKEDTCLCASGSVCSVVARKVA